MALFPLTPALSLGERVPRAPSAEFATDRWFADVRPTLLSLPKGEGWGEGEGSNRPTIPCEDEFCPLKKHSNS